MRPSMLSMEVLYFGGSAQALKNPKGCSIPGSRSSACTGSIHDSLPTLCHIFSKHICNDSEFKSLPNFASVHWENCKKAFCSKTSCKLQMVYCSLNSKRNHHETNGRESDGAQPSRLRCGAWRVLETSFRDVVALGHRTRELGAKAIDGRIR